MVDRTDGAESEPTATDASDGSHNHRSDAAGSYPDDARSPLARWSRRAIRSRLDPRQTALPEWVGGESTPARGTTPVNRAARTVLSPRVVVTVGLVADLSLRTLVDVGPILTTFVGLLAPVVSLSAGTVTPAVVGRLTTWLVLLGVLYAIAPRLFPRAVRSKLDTVGFRLLFVGITGVFGLILGSGVSTVRIAITTVFGTVGGVVSTAAYFWWRPNWELFHPEGEGTAFLDAIARADMVAERRSDWERTGAVGTVADTLHVVVVGLLVCLPAFAAGILAVGFLDTQPLPDLLAIGLLAVGLVGFRPRSDRFVTADFEERVLSNVREATRTLKGAMLSLLLAATAAVTALLLSVVLGTVPNLARLTANAAAAGRVGVLGAFGTAWVAVGAVCCLLVGALQLLWVSARLFRRLPPFLAAWRGADEVPSVSVARPPGWIVPGFLALATGGGCLFLLDARPLPTVGWLWPLGTAPAVLAPLVARRRDAALDGAVLETENRYFVLTVSSQTPLLVTGSWVFVRIAEGQPLGLAALDGSIRSLIAVSTLLPLLGYLPDVSRYANRHDGVGQYAHAAYLTMVGIWFAVLGVGINVPVAVVLQALGGFTLVGAVALAATTFAESE